ncbi:helix-hairpin-helix domain-containing protein [Pseudomonas corrugata]|uniref:ComEA family DNA-binding protein n=1 Tax=Pseudomonas corrugata TaxID=47879 RepID=UPI00069D2EAD|nr:helix-hairpin-helix domain-containing protein [Pseudomonas corrugata]AOE64671.1 competence protein ComEA [Pseudomonas corrugata]MDU9031994.1 helix-hairpin-helix domain-containing protein [Pseudomonas corrugata]UZD97175.1 helix-hairpin-helix domain-containing protein [Pseudomonas corrugata]SDU99983.1 competence protein ComEA [Pseudomonas corrugata]
MRTGYFYSLVFALLTSASIAAIAAPSARTETPPQAVDIAAKPQDAKVNLNEADAPTLQRELAGIGEAKAKAIVAYRETNGAFSSVEELLEVKGIGKAILDRNLDKLEVN